MRVLELFAGLGSWGRALQCSFLDYEIVDIVEKDERLVKCYNLLNRSDFIPKCIKEVSGDKYKDVDLIVQSPPNKELFNESLRLVEQVKPKFIVTSYSSNSIDETFKDMFLGLTDKGYKCKFRRVERDYKKENTFIIVVVREDIYKDYDLDLKDNYDLLDLDEDDEYLDIEAAGFGKLDLRVLGGVLSKEEILRESKNNLEFYIAVDILDCLKDNFKEDF